MLSQMTGRKLRLFGGKNKSKEPKLPRILFVTHEATRTGAPKIILNILKHFAQQCEYQCETIMHSGGHLAEDFLEHSMVHCLNQPRQRGELLEKRVRRIVQRQKDNTPLFAFCNSMESRFIAEILASFDIPLISLVHELPSSYTEEDYELVYSCSNKVVFPVDAVRVAAEEKLPVPSGKSLVLSQGLLDADFGSRITKDVARSRIRQELGLPENSFIVLGCGTLDLRKGIDHFANVARRVVELNQSETPIHFVWAGDGPRWPHSPYHYVQLDLDNSPAREFVHFIGERDNVEPYFMGADSFLMSSRVDPFPCVIHEAMVCGLPVIAFADSGGAPEAIKDGAGFIVPYANYEQTATIIRVLADKPFIAQSVVNHAKERVEANYRFEDYANNVIDVAEGVLNSALRTANRIQPKPRIAA